MSEITADDRGTARMLRDHVRQWLPHRDRTDALDLLDKILDTEPRLADWAGEQTT